MADANVERGTYLKRRVEMIWKKSRKIRQQACEIDVLNWRVDFIERTLNIDSRQLAAAALHDPGPPPPRPDPRSDPSRLVGG